MNKEAKRQELQKEAEKLAAKIAQEYKPEKIILFGSAATGDIHEDSDVDLFVIKDTKKRPIRRDQEVLGLLLNSLEKLALDVVVYTPYEVSWRSKGGDPFVLSVLETGKVLYDTSK